MKIDGKHYWQVRDNAKYRSLVKRHGDPGFKVGKKYLEDERFFSEGRIYVTMTNESGESVAMEARYLKKAKR